MKKEIITIKEMEELYNKYKYVITDKSSCGEYIVINCFAQDEQITKYVPIALINEEYNKKETNIKKMVDKRVNHKTFGLGTIIDVDGNKVKVKFDNVYDCKDERIIIYNEEYLQLVK